MNRIITIGREFGSGGRTVAKMTGERLGISVYDSELLAKIAQESGLAEDYVADRGSTPPSAASSPRASRASAAISRPRWRTTCGPSSGRSSWSWPEKESCVIVGRCADYILRDRADCLRAFIYADLKFRADRIVSVYQDVSQDPPEKRLRDKDKRRSAFYSYHTDMVWGDPHNYHICLDSGTLGFERCRDILCALY